MKEYPLTEGDMRDLSKTGVIAIASFSLSAGLLGFIVDVSKDIAFSSNIPAEVIGFWSGVWWTCLVVCVFAAAIGGWHTVSGYNRIEQIKRETDHDE